MVHEALQRAVLLCIDDNQDVLDCERAFSPPGRGPKPN
jgi:hypothetical protein